MGVLDFLFEGSPPPSTTTYGSTVSNMPQWLSDYTQAIIARANTQAAEPYQQYGGPRVAGFTDDQNNAFDVIRNNIGGWNDEFEAGKQATQGGLSQAMPYFQQAGQSTPSQIQQYMDPYVGNVIDRGTQLANRNYQENIEPAISARFIGGGQSGSTAHQYETNRAARDLTEGVQSNAMSALSQAYQTAGTQFQNDASRYAGLGTSVGSLGLQQGRDLAGLATQEQSLGLKDAQALDASGQEQQQQTQKNLDTAYGDFQSQRDYPRQNVDWLNNIVKGVPSQNTTQTSSTGPGSSFQPSPISQLISLYGLYKDVKSARGGLIDKRARVPMFADGGSVKALKTAASEMDSIIAKALGIAVGGRGGLSSLEFNYGT